MNEPARVAENLVAAFLSGSQTLPALVRRGVLATGAPGGWVRSLARLALRVAPSSPADPRTAIHAAILNHRDFQSAVLDGRATVRRFYWLPSAMLPARGTPASWGVPPLTSPGSVAQWLELETGRLEWFADCQGREARAAPGPFRHYTYSWRSTSSGKVRLLETPKARLKAIQHRILREILDQIPPHEAAHGFRAGRSISSFARPHLGQRVVVRMDLADFFPSVTASRVHAIFRAVGYPYSVARLLTGLCTNVVPPDVWPPPGNRVVSRSPYLRPHLPQGAPTSPALANLCAFHLDCRLAALARTVGAAYTRYADDLAFSGDRQLERSVRRFHVMVCQLALEESFAVNTRKTAVMRAAVRQQLAGVVVNRRPNIRRTEFDRLKAILHNCIRHGPRSQNRDRHPDFRAHLLGRIAYVQHLHPLRGWRLRKLFDSIRWDEETA